MQIGPHSLPNRLFVAPMAGVTDRPFRQLCRGFGAGYAVSEKASPLDRGAKSSTWTGWMGAGSVHAQVLVVPVVLAIFGIGIATIIGVIV